MKMLKLFLFVLLFCFSYMHVYADKIAAIVDDEVITEGDIDRAMMFMRYQNNMQHEEDAKKKVLDHMIESKLLYSEAKRQKIEPDLKQVRLAIERIKEHFDNEEAFEESLKKEGLSVNALYDKFKEQSMVKTLVDKEVASKVFVSPVEISKYYEEHKDEFCKVPKIKVNSVLIPIGKDGRETASMEAETIVLSLRDGSETWKDLQGKYGEGIINGWISKDDVSPALYGLFSPDTEVYPDPVELKSGFYIFRVRDVDSNCPDSLEDVKDAVYSKLYKEKFNEALAEFVEKLKDRSYVKVFPID